MVKNNGLEIIISKPLLSITLYFLTHDLAAKATHFSFVIILDKISFWHYQIDIFYYNP